jgi:septal ring factor EnvC (AmiA/AmiB activator)
MRRVLRPSSGWVVCAVGIALAAFASGAPSENPVEKTNESAEGRLAAEEAKLQVLNDKLASLGKELGSLDEKQTTLLGELHRLEVQIRYTSQELELLRLELDRGYREVDELLKQIQALEASIQQLRPYLSSRSTSLYKLGRLSYVRLLLSVEEPSELTRAYRYVSRLARADGQKISRFLSDQEALEETKAALLVRTKEMLEKRNQLEDTTKTLERRKTTKETLLAEIYDRREMTETLMFELEGAREKLGGLLSQLAQGESPELDPVFLPIRLFRGELAWPVAGKVGTRFGKHYHPRFRTVTMQNGIEIEAPLSAAVSAVYDGTVVFASWFQGYGKLLIIVHPTNVYTLYGHLSDFMVEEGDTVNRGDEVALVGDTGSLTGPSLYFEIREGGKPVDPAGWLTGPSSLKKGRTTDSP